MINAFLLFLSSFFGFNTPVQNASNLQSKLVVENKTTPVANDKNFVLLELFTSEGCSSCPAADEALIDLAKQPNVFVLGYHVSYWNRLGWTDAFSKKSFDDRQYLYGDVFKKEGVYTPQVVINGIDATVGSRKEYIQQKIDAEKQKQAETSIALKQSIENSTTLNISWSVLGKTKNSTINLVVVESDISTKVKRGENGGHTLRHVNVVRDIITKNISGTDGTGQITLQPDWNKAHLKLIAFTQENGVGRITGASSVNLQ